LFLYFAYFKIQTEKESPFVLDATTLPYGRGTIVFDGKQMTFQKRRFWILERAGNVKFTLGGNDLKPNFRLTLTGFKTVDFSYNQPTAEYLDEVYIK